MLPYRCTCLPDFVTVSLPFISSRSLLFSSSFSWSTWYLASVSSSGSMMTLPFIPSTIASFPSTSFGISTWTSAGMFIVRARIAVWEFVEPALVTNARTISLSSCTVSDGARSSATRMIGSVKLLASAPPPIRSATRREEISLTSAARPLIYSSSMDANISAKLSPVVATAYSALTFCSLMISSMKYLVRPYGFVMPVPVCIVSTKFGSSCTP